MKMGVKSNSLLYNIMKARIFDEKEVQVLLLSWEFLHPVTKDMFVTLHAIND